MNDVQIYTDLAKYNQDYSIYFLHTSLKLSLESQGWQIKSFMAQQSL